MFTKIFRFILVKFLFDLLKLSVYHSILAVIVVFPAIKLLSRFRYFKKQTFAVVNQDDIFIIYAVFLKPFGGSHAASSLNVYSMSPRTSVLYDYYLQPKGFYESQGPLTQ